MTKKNFTFQGDGLDTTTLSEEGVAMPVLRTDTGKPKLLSDGKTPAEIVLYGPDGQQWRDAHRHRADTRVKRQSDGWTIEMFREAERDDDIDFMVRMTKGWNIELADGRAAPATPEAFAAYYAAFPAVFDQANLFISQRARFTKAS